MLDGTEEVSLSSFALLILTNSGVWQPAKPQRYSHRYSLATADVCLGILLLLVALLELDCTNK